MKQKLADATVRPRDTGNLDATSVSKLKLVTVKRHNKDVHQWVEPNIARPGNRRPPYKNED